MKTLFERIGHLPTTLPALALIGLVAWLHFSDRVLVTEWQEFLTGLEALIALVAARLLVMKGTPKGMSVPTTPPDEEPTDPPATPFPNPSTPRPPKK